MNFFQHQEAARRSTGRLVLLFGAAVVAIVAAVYVVVGFVYAAGHQNHGQSLQAADLWSPKLFLLTAIAVGLVVGAGSLWQIATLASGGRRIAELLGGRLLSSNTVDWRERRLLNVVEEMALASGMPVPAVYVLDHEPGINAFAAGYTPSDAVLGITRGTIETLTRDELQGVVAHEFSHIFNGDMRLNIRLMGVLHGILLISLIGYALFRVALEVRPSRSSSDDKKGDGAAAIVVTMFAVGLALYVLGYIGVFFGHLIKSAVSRQREYLADASAVQFTRNPPGIAGALKKIGALGSRLKSNQAEQASHMFFGNGVREGWLSLTATHPPLVERITRIDPAFDGDFSKERLNWPADKPEADEFSPQASAARRRAAIGAAAGVAAFGSDDATPAPAVSARQAVADVGAPQQAHFDFAASLIDRLPQPLVDEIHDPLGAACTVFALLLHADPADDEPELARLAEAVSSIVANRVRRLVAIVSTSSPETRLPIAQLCMSALRQLTPSQFDTFRRQVALLIRADRRVSLFEFGVYRLILKHLADHFQSPPSTSIAHYSLRDLRGSLAAVLAALADAGRGDDLEAAAAAYQAAADSIRRALGKSGITLPPYSDPPEGFTALDDALNDLQRAAPTVKLSILEACAACIAHDGKLTLDESELLRTIADALDCPMPPPSAVA